MVTETMQDSRRGRLSATSCDVEHATVMQEDLRDCSCLQLQAANPGLMRRRANIDRDILGDGRRGRAGHSTEYCSTCGGHGSSIVPAVQSQCALSVVIRPEWSVLPVDRTFQ